MGPMESEISPGGNAMLGAIPRERDETRGGRNCWQHPPPTQNKASTIDRSYLSALCDDGQYAVRVTKVYKKKR